MSTTAPNQKRVVPRPEVLRQNITDHLQQLSDEELVAVHDLILDIEVPLSMMIRACSRMRATPARAMACLYGEMGWTSLISSCGIGTAPP
jgi:hypothetical protein